MFLDEFTMTPNGCIVENVGSQKALDEAAYVDANGMILELNEIIRTIQDLVQRIQFDYSDQSEALLNCFEMHRVLTKMLNLVMVKVGEFYDYDRYCRSASNAVVAPYMSRIMSVKGILANNGLDINYIPYKEVKRSDKITTLTDCMHDTYANIFGSYPTVSKIISMQAEEMLAYGKNTFYLSEYSQTDDCWKNPVRCLDLQDISAAAKLIFMKLYDTQCVIYDDPSSTAIHKLLSECATGIMNFAAKNIQTIVCAAIYAINDMRICDVLSTIALHTDAIVKAAMESDK